MSRKTNVKVYVGVCGFGLLGDDEDHEVDL